MKNNRILLIYILFLGVFAACNKPDPDPERGYLETFQAIHSEIGRHSQAYQSLKLATDSIGHRLTGTENGRLAEQFTYDLFRSYGFEAVRFQQFKMTAWMRMEAGINFSRGMSRLPSKCVALAHTPLSAKVSEELVDIGNGLATDFEENKEGVKGKIVLVNLGIFPHDSSLHNLHRSEKTTLAIEYGAAGVVFINNKPGNIMLTGTASVTGELIPIPVVCVTHEKGLELRENEGWRAEISMKNESREIGARNVIATLPGNEIPHEKIIIGGHLDSWDLATGAIDNGIGSFTILEIARAFKALNLRPRRTIEFVMFMGEEQGLFGSKAMVAELKAAGKLDSVRYVVNLDMAGNAIGFNASGRDEMEAFLRETGEEIAKTDTLFKNAFRNRAGLHSDHQPFMMEGIPTLGVISNLDPGVYKYYHSDGDDFSLVNKEHMENCAKFTAMMLYALADADTIPAGRLSDAETRDFLIRHNLKEKLVLGKEWKWEE